MSCSRPPPPKSAALARAVNAINEGDPKGSAELLPLVYSELRKLAHSLMAKVPPGGTLQTTALVHEAYLRLVGDVDVEWNGRGHFFGAAARAMRRILVDQARRNASIKRGGGRRRVDLDWDLPELAIAAPSIDILALDEALERLEKKDSTKVQIVMLRYFAGLNENETATLLDVPLRSLQRDWQFVRAWLYVQLSDAKNLR